MIFETKKMNKTELKARYDRLVSFSNELEQGSIPNVFEAMVRRNDESNYLRKIIIKGCGNKIDINGDCMYISDKGTRRYCSTCKKRLTFINKIVK